MLFDILAIISTLVVIVLLRRLVNVLPSLMACLLRWKENVNLQLSLKMRTDRNLLATAMVLPFCLCVYRFRVYCPGFMSGLTEDGRLWATIGVFALYIMVRIGCRYIFRLRSTPAATYKTAADSARTYFIALTLLLLTVSSIETFIGVTPTHIRTAMFWLSGATYLVFLIRKTQIFYSSCSLFASFLYLCALEILPTGALIASAVVFR